MMLMTIMENRRPKMSLAQPQTVPPSIAPRLASTYISILWLAAAAYIYILILIGGVQTNLGDGDGILGEFELSFQHGRVEVLGSVRLYFSQIISW